MDAAARELAPAVDAFDGRAADGDGCERDQPAAIPGNARIYNVGKSQSCMVSKSPIIQGVCDLSGRGLGVSGGRVLVRFHP